MDAATLFSSSVGTNPLQYYCYSSVEFIVTLNNQAIKNDYDLILYFYYPK